MADANPVARANNQSTPPTNAVYQSQSARDAQASNYGGPGYWDYLDRSALEKRDYYLKHGEPELAAHMLTRSLSESLMGNDGD